MIYISSDFYLHLGETEPDLKYPRIGYENLASSVIASSTATGYRANAMLNNYTYERWSPTAYPATLVFEASEIAEMNYIGIGAHTLSGFAVKVEISLNGADYTEVAEFISSTNNAIMVLFEKTEMKYVRITITGSGTAEIGVVYFGEVLVMQRSLYGGHTPILLGRETEITPHISDEGEFLGTTVVRRALKSNYNFSNLTASWIRETFDAFIQHARTEPFFIAWKPDTYLNEVVYGWCGADIKPSNMGKRDFMSVSFEVRGYNEL